MQEPGFGGCSMLCCRQQVRHRVTALTPLARPHPSTGRRFDLIRTWLADDRQRPYLAGRDSLAAANDRLIHRLEDLPARPEHSVQERTNRQLALEPAALATSLLRYGIIRCTTELHCDAKRRERAARLGCLGSSDTGPVTDDKKIWFGRLSPCIDDGLETFLRCIPSDVAMQRER